MQTRVFTKVVTENRAVCLSYIWLVATFLIIPFSTANTLGQQKPSTQDDPVVAVVGDQKIFLSQIEHEFHKKFQVRQLDPPVAEQIRLRILTRLCDQQLILERLAGTEMLANDDEIDLEVSQLQERLDSIGKSMDQYLQENKQSMAGLRFNYRWQRSWKACLDQTLNDEVLERYFQRHRRKFDGTRMQVAQILFKIPGDGTVTAEEVEKAAAEVRRQIQAEEINWAKAARQHSQSPTASNDGMVGWIDYQGPMSRNFTEAAFQLQVDEISSPVQTPFGIHLIRCVQIQAGTTPWYDARPEILRTATLDLFDRWAGQQRSKTEVRLTGKLSSAAGADSSNSSGR